MTVDLIKHSKSSINGKEILTYSSVYPRIVHAELMTHRLFSRNAASSRAIPINKLIGLIESDCAMPAEWGLNQAGMQARGVHKYPWLCEQIWRRGAKRAIQTTRELQEQKLHKQICNRPLECYQYIKTIITATEWDNFFWLRKHDDADPTIQKLAQEMWEAKEASTPDILKPGEYHLPYVTTGIDQDGGQSYQVGNKDISLDQAIKISTSCCAQVSYRVLDDSLDKAVNIYTQLVGSDRLHASPMEHPATPMEYPSTDGNEKNMFVDELLEEMPPGEHMDSEGNFWSGNFKGWYQYRQEIPDNTCWGLPEDY